MNTEEQSKKTDLIVLSKSRLLIAAGFYLASIVLAGYVGSNQQTRQIATTQSEAQKAACDKFDRGEVKAINVASLGVIPGIQSIANEAQKVEVQLAKHKTLLTDQNLTIIVLKEHQNALNSLLKQRLEGACKVLK